MNIVEQLKRDEGVKLYPYTDTVGKLTIGVGHNLTDRGLRPTQILYLLNDDIEDAKALLDHLMPWANAVLDEARYGALLNMVFNMGDRIMQFKKFLGHLQAREWGQASEDMMDSKWAHQVGDGPGLKYDRAERLAKQIEIGVWQ